MRKGRRTKERHPSAEARGVNSHKTPGRSVFCRGGFAILFLPIRAVSVQLFDDAFCQVLLVEACVGQGR